MKRIFSILLIAAMALPVLANDSIPQIKKVGKDYSEYLPKAGEFSLGFALNPFVNFVGNMFNGTVEQVFNEQKIGGDVLFRGANYPMVSLTGKYMLTDNLGVRANIGFLMNFADSSRYVKDDLSVMEGALVPNMVEDRAKFTTFGGTFMVGAEYRVGKTRPVQGVFSGNLMYSLASSKADFSYGNAMTALNQNPTSAFSPALLGQDRLGLNDYRVLHEYASYTHTVGLVCTAGIEWFVAPKVALGAELDLAFLYRITPKAAQQIEGYVPMTGEVKKATIIVGESYQGLVFGTQNIGGNLYVNFYF